MEGYVVLVCRDGRWYSCWTVHRRMDCATNTYNNTVSKLYSVRKVQGQVIDELRKCKLCWNDDQEKMF